MCVLGWAGVEHPGPRAFLRLALVLTLGMSEDAMVDRGSGHNLRRGCRVRTQGSPPSETGRWSGSWRRSVRRVCRVYEESMHSEGARVLIDRIWPRGLSKRKPPSMSGASRSRRRQPSASGTPTPRRAWMSSTAAPGRVRRARTCGGLRASARPGPAPTADSAHRHEARRHQRGPGPCRTAPALTLPGPGRAPATASRPSNRPAAG